MPAIHGVKEVTYPAGADHSSNKHRAGVINASSQVVVAGAGVLPAVIIMNATAVVGEATNCHQIPQSQRVVVQLGGTVAAGDQLTTDASADFVTGTSGDKFCLIALEGGVSGELVMAAVVSSDTVA